VPQVLEHRWRALGELRGVFGVHVARLAAPYGLDVKGDLGTILPAPAEEDDGERPTP